MMADLHLHSTASDGVLSPGDLVAYVQSKGVQLMALTDHDTMDGVEVLQRDSTALLRAGMALIPGVEMSMSNMKGLHLLGYGKALHPKLQSVLADLKASRFHRMEEMVCRLADLGIHVDVSLDQLNAPGRPHIARELVKNGAVSDLKEAFGKYLGHGCPAYVPGKKLSMEEAIPLLRDCGYIPVLAHPAQLPCDPQSLEPLLRQWVQVGLMGIEVYHPSNNAAWQAQLLAMAKRHLLLVTGGSDFHQSGDRHGEPGCMMGMWRTVDADLAALQQALQAA